MCWIWQLSHTLVCLSVCGLPVSHLVCLSCCNSVFFLLVCCSLRFFIHLPVCLSAHLPKCPSVDMYACPSFYHNIIISEYLYTCPYVYLTICLCVFLSTSFYVDISICLSVCLSINVSATNLQLIFLYKLCLHSYKLSSLFYH